MLGRILQLAADALGARAKTPPQSAGVSAFSSMMPQSGEGAMYGIDPCPPATIETYRKMLANPTVKLGLSMAKAPIVQSAWSVEIDDGIPDDRKRLIEDWVVPLRSAILRDGLRALEFGHYPFEIIWGLEEGRAVPLKIKPLRPEKTQILRDKQTGSFAGFKNGGVTLEPDDCLLITLDGEAGDLQGRSRLESIREDAWWPWKNALNQIQSYTRKAAGIIPRVQYPVGVSKVQGGQDLDNSVIAKRVMESIMRGQGVCMPRKLDAWAEDMLQQGANPKDLMSWQIDFIESSSSHGGDLSGLLTKFEALMLRGLLVPERSATEGTNGTKAEAEAHGSVLIDMAEDSLQQIIETINWHLVDKVLRKNYGDQAAGTVRIKAAPIQDEKADMLRGLVREVLTNPANVDVLLSLIDIESAAEQVGLPIQERQPTPDAAKPSPLGIAEQAIQAGLTLRAG